MVPLSKCLEALKIISTAVLKARMIAGTNAYMARTLPPDESIHFFKKSVEKYKFWDVELSDNDITIMYTSLSSFNVSLDIPDPNEALNRVSVHRLVERLTGIPSISPSLFIFVFIYMDRILQRHPGIFLNKWNFHKLTFGCFCIAIKYHEEREYSFPFVCNLAEMNQADALETERRVLILLNYEFKVTEREVKDAEILLAVEALNSSENASCYLTLLESDVDNVVTAIDLCSSTDFTLEKKPIGTNSITTEVDVNSEEESDSTGENMET